MSCDRVQQKLTGYLDGELSPADGSFVRGHLRECASCRQVAGDEAVLRDGLRQLPAVDPPPSLWAGVQAQLAAAEVADAKKPAWKRALASWLPALPRMAAGALVAGAAVGVLWWKAHRGSDEPVVEEVAVTSPAPAKTIAPPPSVPSPPSAPSADDITADLSGEAARTSATYAQTVDELLALVPDAAARWSAAQRSTFDGKVAAMRASVDKAELGRAKDKAWRQLVKYVQGAVTRDDVALAGGGQ